MKLQEISDTDLRVIILISIIPTVFKSFIILLRLRIYHFEYKRNYYSYKQNKQRISCFRFSPLLEHMKSFNNVLRTAQYFSLLITHIFFREKIGRSRVRFQQESCWLILYHLVDFVIRYKRNYHMVACHVIHFDLTLQLIPRLIM